MTSLGSTASEVLKYGKTMFVKASMGAFTASSIVFDGGLVHEDNTTGRRVGTYATPLRVNDLVKIDATADDDDLVVQRMAASDDGNLLFGIVHSLKPVAGATLHDCVVYYPGDGDILEFVADAAITVGQAVDLAADAYDETRSHGFKVVATGGTGIGYALNETAADGDTVRVMIKKG